MLYSQLKYEKKNRREFLIDVEEELLLFIYLFVDFIARRVINKKRVAAKLFLLAEKLFSFISPSGPRVIKQGWKFTAS